jgi:hypothetical protein
MASTFRADELEFLQTQHGKALAALTSTEKDRDEAKTLVSELQLKFKAYQMELDRIRSDRVLNQAGQRTKMTEQNQLDAAIQATAERNKQLRTAIQEQETILKGLNVEGAELENEHLRLNNVCNEYVNLTKVVEGKLSHLEDDEMRAREEKLVLEKEREQLMLGMDNLKMHAKAELEDMEKDLQVERKKNTELLIQMRHNEIAEKKFQQDLVVLMQQKDDASKEQLRLKAILDGAGPEHELYLKQKQDLQLKLESKQQQGIKIKELIEDGHVQVRKLRDTFDETGKALRDAGTNIYTLSDQLRMMHFQRKKRIDENTEKKKILETAEKTTNVLQNKLQIEQDAHQNALNEMRKSEQLVALFKKKFKVLEEAATLAQRAAEKADRDTIEAREKGVALQTQNSYMLARIEAVEEDVGMLRADIRKTEVQAVKTHQELKDEEHNLKVLSDELSILEAECAKIQAELDFVKREDLLDDTGRVKPLLIESQSDSTGLVAKLNLNDFLIRAQREPKQAVPMLIEKMAQILELIHSAQTQADQYLVDLNRSNNYITQLRSKNTDLSTDISTLETFRTQAVMKFMANSLLNSYSQAPNLFLGSLGLGILELQELLHLLQAHKDRADLVEKISLRDSGFGDEAIPVIKEIISAVPYVKEFDLRENKLTEDGITGIADAVRLISGITGVGQDDKRIIASSGQQMRLTVFVDLQKIPPVINNNES